MSSFFQAHLGEFCALGTAFFWTLCTLAWTTAGKRIGAMAVCINRLIFATLLLMICSKIFRGSWLPHDASLKIWAILLISGFIGFFLADMCIFKALLVIGPRLSLLMQSLTPPVAAIISFFYLREPLRFVHWLGMAITIAGVVWVVLERPESPKELHHRKDFAWGIFLAVAAALFNAVSQVLSKQIYYVDGYSNYDPFAVTLIRILGGLACFPLLFTFLHRWRQIGNAALDYRAAAVTFLGAIVGPFLGVVLNMKALGLCSTGVVVTLVNTAPVMVLPLTVLFYKEKVSPRAALGAAISMLGVALLMLWPK
jgi:drug/metabolite transporter (DMT)-like permease